MLLVVATLALVLLAGSVSRVPSNAALFPAVTPSPRSLDAVVVRQMTFVKAGSWSSVRDPVFDGIKTAWEYFGFAQVARFQCGAHMSVVSSKAPSVASIDYLLTTTERQSVIDAAVARGFRRSRIGQQTQSVVRTSSGVFLDREFKDNPANVVLRARAAQLLGLPNRSFFEPTQVLRYRPGMYYRPHFDSIPKTAWAEQRIATVIVYLSGPDSTNHSQSGGETRFAAANASVSPKAGSGVLFYNILRNATANEVTDANDDGETPPAFRPDRTAAHESVPPVGWTKYVAVLWAHAVPPAWQG